MDVGVVPVVVVAGVLLVLAVAWATRRRSDRRYARLVDGDLWSPTSLPVGLDAQHLVTWTAFPRGERGYGVRHAATRTERIDVAGRVASCELAVFTWWWEQRVADHRGNTDHEPRSVVAAAVRLPVAAPALVIEDGRLSSESGRVIPFEPLRLAVADRTRGRLVELRGGVLALVDRADPTVRPGGVGTYGSAAADLLDLVAHVPDDVWHAVAERRRERRGG